jgi:asparagine synthase (glutamine-hydrolysing)
MCGIAGLASFVRPVSEALVRRMTATLTHRGPDEDGFYAAPHAALGARRLSIIDVAGSHQPVRGEDRGGGRRVWAVFNGELYNFKALRAELAALGHRFETQGDSEVVAHAWEEWGERSTERLRGMFAFALWDEREETLLLVRDRVGIKPLYWAWDGRTLLFGSEMKALLCAGVEHPLGSLDAAALRAFLCFGYVPAPLSMFEGARCLPPGHQLVLRRGGAPALNPYWELPRASEHGLLEDEGQAIAEFRELLAGSVTDQMVSDVPIGAFLSGGIDSTAVVWRMTEASRASVRTFSVGFAERSYDETPWARRVARRFGSTHEEELITPKQVAAEIGDIVGIFDEPFADSSAIPLHFLARMTRAHGVTVALTGDGGDEIFGGYETYLASRLLARFQGLPRWIQAAARRGIEALPVSHGKISLEQKLKRFMALSGYPAMVAHARWRAIFWAAELPELLGDGLADGLTEPDVAALLVGDLRALPDPGEGINAFCWADTRSYLPADMLVKVDRVTMAHSLEARVPLLDERLVDFAFRLHPRLKWRWRTGKWLMRRALRGVADPEVLARPKAGFNVPMPVWIAGPLRELFRDVLAPTALRRAGLVRSAYVERLLAEHDARRADHSFRLYALLVLHLWLERWGRAGTG